MTTIGLAGSGVSIADIAAIARQNIQVTTDERVIARLVEARVVLERVAASGQPIYGMNTGLGANLKTSVTEDFGAFQLQLIRGRGMAVGEPLSRDVTRAVIAARLAMLAVGGSGISPGVFAALLALLNAGVHPVMRSVGSIGAGDLVLLSVLARVLVGEGEADYQGEILPAAEALNRAGLGPVVLKPKDGIALLNASAVSVGEAALVLYDLRRLLGWQRQAAALSFEGMAGNPAILAPAIQVARPAPGQVEEARALSDALQGSSIFERAASIQDPLSLRCVAVIQGAFSDALERAECAVELELNSAADNPLVLVQEGRVLSTGNFHTPALSLAFETLGLALAQAASASAARFIQLTGTGRDGLPRYLSPVGGPSAGYVPMQKTVTALIATMRHNANPVMLDFIAVSEGVEDHSTQSVLAVRKLGEMLTSWRSLIACEMIAAAQAVGLRQGHRCGSRTQTTYDMIRNTVPALQEDRPLGDDVAALSRVLEATASTL